MVYLKPETETKTPENVTVEAISTDPFQSCPEGPILASASGCWVWNTQRQRFFDGSAGSGAVNLGHQHPRVVEAAINQVQRLIHTGWNLQSDVRVELLNKLGCFSPYDSCATLFAVTGTEAIEAALKIARAYTGRNVIIAFERSYHGKSTGALSVTWRESFKRYNVLPKNAVLVAPFPLLHLRDAETQPAACLHILRQMVQQLCASKSPPAALILEPIQASEGILPAGNTFLEGVFQIAKEADCLIIFDEIYTGFGRSGSPFYASRPGLTPDVLVVGKGLGNGFPISAVLGTPSIVNALPAGTHTSTFSGHPVACAVGNAVLDVLVETRIWEQATEFGNLLFEFFKKLASEFKFIANPRGEGLMLAFDCLDRQGRPSPSLANRFIASALSKGIIMRYGGFNNCSIKLTPPLTIGVEEVEFLTRTLSQVVRELY